MTEIEPAPILSYAPAAQVPVCERTDAGVHIQFPFDRRDFSLPAWRALYYITIGGLSLATAGSLWGLFLFVTVIELVAPVNLKIRPLWRLTIPALSVTRLDYRGLRCWNLRDEKYKSWKLESLPHITVARSLFSNKACIKMTEHRIAIYKMHDAEFEDVQWAASELNAAIDALRQKLNPKMST